MIEGYMCEKCGMEVPPGGWPFCKGGHGVPTMVVIAHGEIYSKHLGGMRPKRFGSMREHDRYCDQRGIVPLRDTPVTEGERNAIERGKERSARYREGRPDKIEPLPQSEAL